MRRMFRVDKVWINLAHVTQLQRIPAWPETAWAHAREEEKSDQIMVLLTGRDAVTLTGAMMQASGFANANDCEHALIEALDAYADG